MDVTYNAGRKTSKLRPPNTIDGEALQDTLEDYYDPNTHTVTTYVNGNRITRSTDSKGNITTTTEPINKEVTKYEPPKDLVKRMNGNNLRDIYLVLSNKVTAKLLQLMKEIQDIEWGSYIVYKTQIPNDPMWEITEDNQEPIEIIIEDLVLIPQKISSGHVEFMEIEYPELMKDLIEYKFSGYFTTGRLHSHHTLGAFHSGTDLGEFEKYFSAGDKLLSIVASFKNHQAKQTFKNTDLKAPNSVELLMSCLDFHSMIGIPEVSIEIPEIKNSVELGIIRQVALKYYGDIDPYIEEAEQFLVRFKEMLEKIKKTELSFIIMKYLGERNKFDENERRAIRSELLSNPVMLQGFTALSQEFSTIYKKHKSTAGLEERLKALIEPLAEELGIVKTVYYTPPAKTGYQANHYDKQSKVLPRDSKDNYYW